MAKERQNDNLDHGTVDSTQIDELREKLAGGYIQETFDPIEDDEDYDDYTQEEDEDFEEVEEEYEFDEDDEEYLLLKSVLLCNNDRKKYFA